jgi:hypothetical protein
LEWFVYRLRSLALFDLLELTGKLTIVVAIVVWFLEADQRARQAEEAIKARHYRAWELINAARGSTGDGGRRDALQDLNKDHVSLAGAPLERAYLNEVDLEGANLQGANLQGASLAFANLHRANLQVATLISVNLQGAVLTFANLQGANLGGTNLEGADLFAVDLRGAFLWGARNLTQEQLYAAIGDDRTRLPAGLTRPAHWAKAEGHEGPPAAQPDDGGRPPAAAGAPGPDK